jgi:HAD superfamily hydrolase (TIGR01509 family)
VTAKRSVERRAKRLVLFDLDGVLLDSRENMRRSWQQVIDRFGTTVSFERYFSEIGKPFPAIMDRLGLSERADAIEAVFRIASMENLDVLRFYPGAQQTLLQMVSTGLKLGIVTSKDKLRTSAILAMLPVDFACVCAPDGKSRGKPAPDHLLLAMAQVGVDPAETLYVGDMAADHEAAVRAGIDYAHAAWGYGPAPVDGSWVLSDMSDLLELTQRHPPQSGEAR